MLTNINSRINSNPNTSTIIISLFLSSLLRADTEIIAYESEFSSKKDFILTGYQIQHSFSQPFACHSFGKELWNHPSPRRNYTKIGEFIVYLNSNKISF